MDNEKEFFLLDETRAFWKIAVFMMFIAIGFILSIGLING